MVPPKDTFTLHNSCKTTQIKVIDDHLANKLLMNNLPYQSWGITIVECMDIWLVYS
jgi:hypothetical protein